MTLHARIRRSLAMLLWCALGLLFGGRGNAADDPVALWAKDPLWLRLGHYEASRFGGGYVSRADSPHFFLAPDGKTDPVAELKATLRAIEAGHPLVGLARQLPHCAFPARRRFLEEHRGRPFSLAPCPDFEEWREGLGARRVTLVFSSYFASSPASTFGHTFLRLDRDTADQRGFGREAMDLLNYGVSFGAYVDTDNAVVYGFKGIFGGFHGFYFIDPYYMKVAEYALHENRDLWEYALDLTQGEVDRLVAHLWEQYGTNYFDYYFFDENCSYQLLALLEVAKPSWHLLDRLGFFVLPVDTVRAVGAEPGGIHDVHYVASYRRRLQAALARLPVAQRADFDHLVNGAVLDAPYDPAVWDAYIIYLQARKMRLKNTLPAADAGRFQAVLQKRARMTAASTEAPLGGDRPDEGHATHRVELGVRHDTSLRRAALYVNAAYGLHDFLDDPYGFAPHMAVNFLGLTASWDTQAKRARWDDLAILDVASFASFHLYDPQVAWYFRAHLPDAELPDCVACRAFDADGGAGMAWSDDAGTWLAYAVAKLGVRHETGAAGPWTAWPGARIGAVWRPSSRLRFLVDSLTHRALDGRRQRPWTQEADLEAAYSLSRQTLLHYRDELLGQAGGGGYRSRHSLGFRWRF